MKKIIMVLMLLMIALTSVLGADIEVSTNTVTSITETEATLTLAFNETANVTVIRLSENIAYTSPVYESSEIVHASSQIWRLTGMDSNTIYYYNVSGVSNETNNSGYEAIGSFTTLSYYGTTGLIIATVVIIVMLGVVVMLTFEGKLRQEDLVKNMVYVIISGVVISALILS